MDFYRGSSRIKFPFKNPLSFVEGGRRGQGQKYGLARRARCAGGGRGDWRRGWRTCGPLQAGVGQDHGLRGTFRCRREPYQHSSLICSGRQPKEEVTPGWGVRHKKPAAGGTLGPREV